MNDTNILLGVTGGIAAFKAVMLLRLLTKAGATVRVLMTESATRFVGPLTFEALSHQPVITDLWQTGERGGETHISLSEWADLFVVAPVTANTIAKSANGLADDLLTCTLLAARCPVVFAPAMFASMYLHPATQANLQLLRSRGVHVVDATVGDLASGQGQGRMAEPEQILETIHQVLAAKDLQGVSLVVSAGPTQEPLDPIRFVSNHSSGKMGYAIARVARRRGADVTLVSGPSEQPVPAGVKLIRVRTARQMSDAVQACYDSSDAIVMAAAVADYAPKKVAPQKIKKTAASLVLELEPTPDILATLGKRRKAERGEKTARPVLVGFAMETEALLENAADKLRRKGCDLIAANNVQEPGAGFGVNTNLVTLLDRGGRAEQLPLMAKEDVAAKLLDRIAAMLVRIKGA